MPLNAVSALGVTFHSRSRSKLSALDLINTAFDDKKDHSSIYAHSDSA